MKKQIAKSEPVIDYLAETIKAENAKEAARAARFLTDAKEAAQVARFLTDLEAVRFDLPTFYEDGQLFQS